MSKQNHPCWLTQQQLFCADALLDQGFDYRGDIEAFDLEETTCEVKKCGDWVFYSAIGEVAILAVCSGAVYVFSDSGSEQVDGVDWFEERLKTAAATIKKAIKETDKKEHQQLTIFDFISQ